MKAPQSPDEARARLKLFRIRLRRLSKELGLDETTPLTADLVNYVAAGIIACEKGESLDRAFGLIGDQGRPIARFSLALRIHSHVPKAGRIPWKRIAREVGLKDTKHLAAVYKECLPDVLAHLQRIELAGGAGSKKPLPWGPRSRWPKRG